MILLMLLLGGLGAAGFYFWGIQPRVQVDGSGTGSAAPAPAERSAPGERGVIEKVVDAVSGKRSRRFSSVEKNGMIRLFGTPESAFMARDPNHDAVLGLCDQGAPCEVIESITAFGTKFYKVRASGKSFDPLDRELQWFLISGPITHEDAPPMEAKIKAIPVSNNVIGWTRWVADE